MPEQEAVLKARTTLLRTIVPHLSIRTEVASSEQSPLELSRGCFRKKIRREQSYPFVDRITTPEPKLTLARW